MNDWVGLSRRAGFKIDYGRILVPLGARRQFLNVEEGPGPFYRLWTVAVPAWAARDLAPSADEFAWERNRKSDLVGFRVDGKGRILGEAIVPVDEGLDEEEWKVWVLAVARASDRLEYLVSGRDEQ